MTGLLGDWGSGEVGKDTKGKVPYLPQGQLIFLIIPPALPPPSVLENKIFKCTIKEHNRINFSIYILYVEKLREKKYLGVMLKPSIISYCRDKKNCNKPNLGSYGNKALSRIRNFYHLLIDVTIKRSKMKRTKE